MTIIYGLILNHQKGTQLYLNMSRIHNMKLINGIDHTVDEERQTYLKTETSQSQRW